MANITPKKERVEARSVSLPVWMWDIIDRKGKRSEFFRNLLKRDPQFQKEAQ